MRELLGKKKLVVYEVVPTRGTDLTRCLKLCMDMVEAGADVVAITDMPTSKVKVAPWAVARMLLERGVEVLVHFTRISRNILRIESDLLGMHVLGVRNVLLLSGDDPRGGDYPQATAVQDLSTEDLIRLVKMMNEGKDLAGKKLKGETDFLVGAVFNPSSERDLERSVRKVEAGADFLISQPIYRASLMERAKEMLKVPILMSVAFFKNYKQLEYFASIPGIEIPKDLLEDLRAKSDDVVEERTFEEVLKVMEQVWDFVDGFYVSGIVRNVEKVGRLVEFVEDLQGKSS